MKRCRVSDLSVWSSKGGYNGARTGRLSLDQGEGEGEGWSLRGRARSEIEPLTFILFPCRRGEAK